MKSNNMNLESFRSFTIFSGLGFDVFIFKMLLISDLTITDSGQMHLLKMYQQQHPLLFSIPVFPLGILLRSLSVLAET